MRVLRETLDRWAEARRERALAELDALLEEWRTEARAVRRAKLRRGGSERLARLPGEVQAAVVFVPDAGAIVARILPQGLVARLAWRQPAAAVTGQQLDELRRTLAARLDPALARHLARDAVLAEVLPEAIRALGSESRAPAT